jgi:hypothetical protein
MDGLKGTENDFVDIGQLFQRTFPTEASPMIKTLNK